MDRKATVCNPLDLERMLIDERAEPRNLRLSLLESITNNFFEDLEIGSGGFAVVYKGILQNGVVAVKKLSKIDLDEKKFHQEVDSLMRAKHKNIVRFLGYCSDTQGIVHKFNGRHVMAEERQRFLCFEFVPLGSLDKYITDALGGLEWRTRYQIIREICEGLHYLHQQRIALLDLKPGNILLDHYMLPKIADFGLSKCFDEKQSGAVTSNPCGTRLQNFPSPESHDGVITLKSDIYSLGIIIIEILTGKRSCPVIENVLETWSIRFETLKGDTRLEPIRVCIEIGMECTDFNPTKRTDTGRIIARLDEMELKYGIIVADLRTSSETEASSSVSKLVDEVQQSMFMSDEASSPLQRITSSVPKGLGEASSSSMLLSVDDEVESMDVSSVPSPLQLLTIEPKGPGETGDEIRYHNGPSKAGQLLDIYPLELRFPFVPNKVIDKLLTVTNRTDKQVVFCITPICQQGTCSRVRHPYPLLDDTSYFDDDDGCGRTYFEFIEPRSTRGVVMRMENQQEPHLRDTSMFEVVVIIDVPRNDTLLTSAIGRKLNLDITFMKILNSWQIHRAVLTTIVSDPASCQEVIPDPKFIGSPEVLLWGATGNISCIDVHPSKTWILVGGYHKGISIFNYQTQEELITLEVTRPKEGGLRSFDTRTSDNTCVVRSAKFISQEEWFAVGDSHGWVHVYSYNNTKDKVKEFKAYHEISIDLLAVHPTCPFLLSSSEFGTKWIKLWDWAQGWQCIQKFDNGKQGPSYITWNPRLTDTFASTSIGGVKVWKIHSADPAMELEGNFESCCFYGDGHQNFVATAQMWEYIDIWDVQRQNLVHKLHMYSCISQKPIVACHPTLPILVTKEDLKLCFWDTRTYRLEKIYELKSNARLNGLIFTRSTDLPRLVVNCDDGVAIVDINLPTLKTRRTD